MSIPIVLTNQQQVFANHDGAAFIHACPGAGKTRTIISRLQNIAITLPPRRGVALLSFTNAAVDEFQQRCHEVGLHPLLKHPSFTGTLDSFVRHFVILPGCTKTSTVRPIIIDSWTNLGIEIRLSGRDTFHGDGVSLDQFDSASNIIDSNRIGHAGLRNHVSLHQARYQRVAELRRNQLHQAGYLSVADARVLAHGLIDDPLNSAVLGRALSARFYEVIIDEGQDCNPLDLRILSWLRQSGIRVTFVCDPDQAIYQFRDSNPDGLREFKETYPVSAQHILTGNFRSSSPICLLASTLRGTGQADNSVGESASITDPIMLLTYRGRAPNESIGAAFLERVNELGLCPSNVIVLAHRETTAQRASGDTRAVGLNGSSRIEAMARIVSDFSSPSATARTREKSLQLVETMLLDLIGMRQDGEHIFRIFERTGIDRRLYRRYALNLLMSLPRTCANTDLSRSSWIECLRNNAEQLGLPLPQGQTVRQFFRAPPNSRWVSHLQESSEVGLSSSTIHEAKGREYDAVCVVIPPDHAPENHTTALFDSWERRVDTEAKRVIFVGVTRARMLGVLAIPIAFADQCVALLDGGQVPHIRRNL